ncbi:FAD-dependent oxidoreductase [Leptospira interrogans]
MNEISRISNVSGTEADVVVVGGGGAGLAAAIEAARLGRTVILLEKNPEIGGTTGRSVGSITSSSTPFQAKKGIVDTPQAHFEDMALFAKLAGHDPDVKDNLELRRLLVEHSPDTINWLTDMGIVFFGPMAEPPHRVPRMHNILPNSRSYIYHLEKRARHLGVDIRTNARAIEILRTGNRVTGVACEVSGAAQRFTARSGVILAAGDYSSGQELKSAYLDADRADIEGINETSTGDGQRLAVAVGAQMVNGDVVYGPEIRFVAPPKRKLIAMIPPWRPVGLFMRWSLEYMPSWLLRPFLMMFVTTFLAPSNKLFEEGAILVNKKGERFVDETNRPQFAIPKQPDRVAYLIMDDEIARKFEAWPNFVSTAPGVAYAYLADYKRNRKDVYASAASLDELAQKVGIPPAQLRETIDKHNANLPAGKPAIRQGPFHVLGPAKSWIPITDGSPRVSSRLEILDRNGKPIPGLYGAGSSGQGGVLLEGHGHHLGWALTSGRLAGKFAAFGPQEDAEAISLSASPTASTQIH